MVEEGKGASTASPIYSDLKAGSKNSGKSAASHRRRPAHPPKLQFKLTCPECGSERLWRDGLRYLADGSTVQRMLCRNCGFRFSDPNRDLVPATGEKPLQKTSKYLLNNGSAISSKCQISAIMTGDAKNLATVETRHEKPMREGTEYTANVKGKIIEFAWWMKKQGYPESTITPRINLIKLMAKRGADLWNPESVKETIARQETWGNGRKANAVQAYNAFAAMEDLTWTPPRYKKQASIPFIPLESELDQLIGCSGRKLSTYLLGLKETAADPGELIRIEWTDINPEGRSINLNSPVKNHNPRIITGVSTELLAKLNNLPKKQRPFPMPVSVIYRSFWSQRKRISHRLGNPRLLKITFITFRHWKATMEYHRTKDILYVMKLLGHKSLSNTLIYIDLEKAIYGAPDQEEFTVRVAQTLDEACELLEAGFDYVMDMDGKKLFRKRK